MVIRKFIGLSGWVGLLFAALAAVGQPLGARQAPVPRPVSDSLVRHYLARAMTVQNLRLLPVAERRTFTQWAGVAGTRFAGRVGGFWATPRDAQQLQASADTLRQLVADLHRAQPAMVVQGTIFEVIEAHAADLPVPNAARAEFGEDTLAVPQRNFRFADMMYPAYFEADDTNHYRWDDRAPGQAPGIPDMSRPETQLWFYALARQQIDAGCEALHFGQVMRMDDRDAGHHAWWSLLQRVRAYARTRNRGFVLCDAHTHDEYYDPDPAQPLPPSQRQLLFDFHSCPARPIECDSLRQGSHSAYLDFADAGDRSGAIYGRSGGGVAPDGTYREHLPALVELDNGTIARVGEPGQRAWGVVWGVDEISWFANQPAAYRNKWLVYAAARVRQLDSAVYFEIPGLRGVNVPPRPEWLYRADTMGQGAVIRAIWGNKLRRQTRRLLRTGPCQL
jgi:hypothetical protein